MSSKQERHEAAKSEIIDLKEVKADFQTLLNKAKQLPPGQLKKQLDDESKAIYRKWGVDV